MISSSHFLVGLLAFGLVDAGYHRHEFHHTAAETSKGEQQTLMGKAFCPIVARARAKGMTDDQIVASAVANHVPTAVILWAQKNCTVAVR